MISGNPSPDTLIQRTLDLVRIPSPSGEEDAIADHVEQFLRDRTDPLHVARHGKSVTARYGEASPRIILVGHLDTVPHNQNPEPEIAGDVVVGLGTTDMKGALAIMMSLAEAHQGGKGSGDPESLGLVFYDCEEVAYERNGLRKLFEREPWLAEAELAILMEPTDNVVELGCLGTLHAQVTFRGIAAHSARPWTGKNAIHLAAPFLAGLAEVPVREFGEGSVIYREVINVTLAEGGVARNVLPDRFSLNINFRFPPDRTVEEAEEYVRSLVPDGADIEITDLAPAALPRTDSTLLARLIEDHGLSMRAKQAWTDVAQFAERGVPAVNFGPGTPELAHKRNETISIHNLVHAYSLLAHFTGIK